MTLCTTPSRWLESTLTDYQNALYSIVLTDEHRTFAFQSASILPCLLNDRVKEPQVSHVVGVVSRTARERSLLSTVPKTRNRRLGAFPSR